MSCWIGGYAGFDPAQARLNKASYERRSWLTTDYCMKNSVTLLRKLALVEGVSFLILLGIAMPLKYAAGMPEAVKVVGWLHGLLFVGFCFALLRTMMSTTWSFGRAFLVFVSSLVPFGPFLLDRTMRQWEADAANPTGKHIRSAE